MVPIVIGVNIVYVVLLVLGFSSSSSSSSSRYDGSLPYNGTKFGLFGMLVTWIQQGYAYLGIVDNAASTVRSNNLVGGFYLDLFISTIITQLLLMMHSPK